MIIKFSFQSRSAQRFPFAWRRGSSAAGGGAASSRTCLGVGPQPLIGGMFAFLACFSPFPVKSFLPAPLVADATLVHKIGSHVGFPRSGCRRADGIPQPIWYGTEGPFNIMVMQLLGPSLSDLMARYKRLSVCSTLKLGVQMVRSLLVTQIGFPPIDYALFLTLPQLFLLHRDFDSSEAVFAFAAADFA